MDFHKEGLYSLQATELEHDILSEVYRVLGVNVDYSAEPQQDKLFRNPMIRGCLSLQASFGFRGVQKQQTLTAKIASTTLNLRLATQTLTFMFNNIIKPNSAGSSGESDLAKPGTSSERNKAPHILQDCPR